jgi:hypothetical protein
VRLHGIYFAWTPSKGKPISLTKPSWIAYNILHRQSYA